MYLADGYGEVAAGEVDVGTRDSMGSTPSVRKRRHYRMRDGQTFSSLTSFIEDIATFVSLNKSIMKTHSIVYLMILVMHYKY